MPYRVDEALAAGVRLLAGATAAQASSAALDAELLLGHVLRVSRSRLHAHPEAVLDEPQLRTYDELLARRARGEPIAYLLGQKEFWSLPLVVSPAVLIPRPETEILIERALELCDRSRACVADLGTGSGAIALALKSERPQWRVIATDLSAAALEIARANCASLGLQVEFRQGSWLEPLAAERCDLIVSNPPYIGAGDAALADAALRHEPRLALTPGKDALLALRSIVATAPAHLAPGGWLLLEHGAEQAESVRALLVGGGLRHVRCSLDLAGRPRVSEAQRP